MHLVLVSFTQTVIKMQVKAEISKSLWLYWIDFVGKKGDLKPVWPGL